jgi:hypothetical protein
VEFSLYLAQAHLLPTQITIQIKFQIKFQIDSLVLDFRGMETKIIELDMPPALTAFVDDSNINAFSQPPLRIDNAPLHRITVLSTFGMKYRLSRLIDQFNTCLG